MFRQRLLLKKQTLRLKHGADIRFSTSAGKLKDSGLYYWTEKWNEKGTTIIWVKVPVLKAKTRNSIFMLRTLDNDSWDNFAYISVSKYTGSELKVMLGKEQNN